MTENITEGTTHWQWLDECARKNRLVMLNETDWWGLTDVPMTTEQLEYRQSLRDITNQEEYPITITWPTKPE